MSRDLRITRMITRSTEIAFRLQRLHFAEYRSAGDNWCPAVNAVQYRDRIEICVDLAGVDREHVHVSMDQRSLRIRGERAAPHAQCAASAGCRVLMMEIDDGPFERILPLPKDQDFDPDRVIARQEKGLLWITIPIIS